MEMSLMVVSLMAVRLKAMRLGRKFKKDLSPRICLSLLWCNIMIMRPVDHGLHMILSRELNRQPTRNLSTLSFNLHRLCYELFFTPSHHCYNLISLVPTWPPISTSFFWSRSSTCRRLLADQRLSSWWWWSKRSFLTFYKGKSLRGATSEVVKETAGRTRLGLTLETTTSASTIYHTTQWVGVTAK